MQIQSTPYIIKMVHFVHVYTYFSRYMNMSFTNAVFCNPRGDEYHFEQLFVQARNIRYVHIPETVSIFTSCITG